MSIRDELNSIARTLELRWFEHETANSLREIAARAEAAEAAAQRRLELLAQVMFYIPDSPRNALTERAHALNDAIQAEMAKGKGS